MEMKAYQKRVIADLKRYLELLNEIKSYTKAFSCFWKEKSAPSLGNYQDILPGVPNLCLKVPTGGGKTLYDQFLMHFLLPKQKLWYGSYHQTLF